MKSVYSDIFQVHFYRLQHDLGDGTGRTFNGHTSKFYFPLLDFKVSLRTINKLESLYLAEMRQRRQFMQQLGVLVYESDIVPRATGYLRDALGLQGRLLRA